MRIIAACFCLVSLSGCGLFMGGPQVATASAAGCSYLIDPEWEKGVESADPPFDDQTVGGWMKFGDAQTGKLDQANDRTKAAIGITRRCEQRDAAALKKAKGGVIRRIFGENESWYKGHGIKGV